MKKFLFIFLFLVFFPVTIKATMVLYGANVGIPITGPPTVVTNAATNITSTSATLNGTVNPNGASGTVVYYSYGLTTSYGSTSAYSDVAQGNSAVSEPIGITGLTQGSTYHFKICGQNNIGTVCGSDLSFVASVSGTLTRVTSVSTGLTNPTAIAIDPINSNLYVVDNGAFGVGVDPGNSYVFVNCNTGCVAPFHIKKIRLSDLAVIDSRTSLNVAGSMHRFSTSALSSEITNNNGYGSNNNSVLVSSQFAYVGSTASNSVTRVDLGLTPGVQTNVGGSGFSAKAGQADFTNDTLYYTSPVDAVVRKITNASTTFSVTATTGINEANVAYYSGTIDLANQFLYLGTTTLLSKVNLATFVQTAVLTFNEVSPTSITPNNIANSPTPTCVNSANTVFCVRDSTSDGGGTWNPSWVTSIKKSTFTELSPALVLNSGESRIIAGVIDTVGNNLYLLSYDAGTIIKVSYVP